MSIPSTTWYFTEVHWQWELTLAVILENSSTIIVRVGMSRTREPSLRDFVPLISDTFHNGVRDLWRWTVHGTRINRVHMVAHIRTMHTLVLFHVAHGTTTIHRWSIGETSDARPMRSHPGRARQPSGPLYDGRIRARNAGGRAQKRKIYRMIAAGSATTVEVGYKDDATRNFVRASKPLQRGCRTADVNPQDGWNAMIGKERERERQSGRRGDGREYYEGRRRTKERRRGVAPFSRGSIDASASFVDFRAENADARDRPPRRAKGVVIRKREYAARVVTDYGIN